MRDIYLYKNSNVLKNKLGIKDAAAFEKAEVNLTCNAIYELEMSPLPGSYDYFSHYCAVHQYIFRDVYDWVGVPRTVPMEKGEDMPGKGRRQKGLDFCPFFGYYNICIVRVAQLDRALGYGPRCREFESSHAR